MNELPKVQYLLRRDGHHYYRRRVPKELVGILGQREIKVSLGTSDLSAIREKIALENLKAEEMFSNARRAQRASPAQVCNIPATLTQTELERMCLLWFRELERTEEEQFFLSSATLSPEDRIQQIDSILEELSALESGRESVYLPAVQPVSKKY